MKDLHRRILLIALLLFSASAAASEITFVHPDHLGSPIAHTDVTGNVIGREYYTPYGEPINAPDNDGINFTGHVRDSDTGLLYMQARYYDPGIGRFLSVDPVTFGPDKPDYFNRYWYAGGNPIKNIDPDGQCFAPPVAVGCAIGGVVVIGLGIVRYNTDPNAKAGLDGLGQAIADAATEVGELVFNESEADPLQEVLKGATPGDETKGRTTNWEKSGGESQKESDFGILVPDGGSEAETSQGEKIRVGTTNDGRTVISRPSTKDGRPTLEIQDGKNKTKIRYDD